MFKICLLALFLLNSRKMLYILSNKMYSSYVLLKIIIYL